MGLLMRVFGQLVEERILPDVTMVIRIQQISYVSRPLVKETADGFPVFWGGPTFRRKS